MGRLGLSAKATAVRDKHDMKLHKRCWDKQMPAFTALMSVEITGSVGGSLRIEGNSSSLMRCWRCNERMDFCNSNNCNYICEQRGLDVVLHRKEASGREQLKRAGVPACSIVCVHNSDGVIVCEHVLSVDRTAQDSDQMWLSGLQDTEKIILIVPLS